MEALPWISIPTFAQPGQAHAFANREKELAAIYQALVNAGNAVRKGRMDVRQKHVVSGYMGVGKSALLLQVLGMIRGELVQRPGLRVKIPEGLPQPIDPQRWVILRISGKQFPNIEALADAIRGAIAEEEDSAREGRSDPMLDLLQDLADQAHQEAPGAMRLSILHRLLRTRENKLYGQVRSALSTLALTIEYVRRWQGGLQTDKLERTDKHEGARDAEARIEAQLKALTGAPGTREAQAAIKLAAGTIRKVADAETCSSQVERQWRINSDLLVDPLNAFFRATNQARLPTLLILDDFDEFTSAIGPSHEARSRVLSLILGSFGRLRPTCLVLGLRQEYMHEDIFRVFQITHVPPMTRACAALSIEAWAEVQQPTLAAPEIERLKALGERLLQRFTPDEPAVVPYRFLPIVVWLANQGLATEKLQDERALLLRYLNEQFFPDAVRAMVRVANVMPDEDVLRCAAASPLDPAVYSLSDGEMHALESAGLLRPAMAGDPADRRIVLDPLGAYLHTAGQR